MPEHALSVGVAVVVALAIDHVWGEPPARWHPVVWMGRALQRAQRWLFAAPHGAGVATPARLFWRGALAWLSLAVLAVAAALLLVRAAGLLPWWLHGMVLGMLLKPLLAWRMLHQEVAQVEAALQQSLPAGQQQLARLVSRDVTLLDAAQVRESAIESLAENLSDSVIAPLCWFVLLGLPGAVLYRFANTADAMWGYPGERGGRDWQWAGKWAARSDDVLNWLPARLTAWLLLLGHPRCAKPWLSHWRRLRAEAAKTPSPNSGWPMAAMALLLQVRLGKPGHYVLNAQAPVPTVDSVAQAIRCGQRAIALAMVLLIGLLMAACAAWGAGGAGTIGP